MYQYSFTRTKAVFKPDGHVTFTSDTHLDNEEIIEIAGDWQSGEDLMASGQSYEKTGFIGKGFTKRGIYVHVLVLHFNCMLMSEPPS
jgi:hypothetical protein